MFIFKQILLLQFNECKQICEFKKLWKSYMYDYKISTQYFLSEMVFIYIYIKMIL